jgi:hypothetical protein
MEVALLRRNPVGGKNQRASGGILAFSVSRPGSESDFILSAIEKIERRASLRVRPAELLGILRLERDDSVIFLTIFAS